MIITYHGAGHIKLQVGDLTFALGPVSKSSKRKQVKYGADVALIPIWLPDYNGADNVARASKEPFVISGAGEYEVAGSFIRGFETKSVLGGKEYVNTSYVFNFDGMRVVYLGALHTMLAPEHKEIIDETDVLIIAVGGDDKTLNAYDANKLAVQLEPKIIIPIDYEEKDLAIFLKESGSESVHAVEKLTIKSKDIAGKEGEVVVLDEM